MGWLFGIPDFGLTQLVHGSGNINVPQSGISIVVAFDVPVLSIVRSSYDFTIHS
jgi:hypothetical protein